MATELERLLVRIDATTEGLRRELKRAETGMDTATRSIDKNAGMIEKRLQQIGVAAGVYLGAQGIRKVIQYSDSWKQLEGRLNTVTGSARNTAKAQKDLFDVSQKTGTALAANTGLYVRLNQSLDANQKKQFDVLKITETVAKSFAITGESAASMQGAVTQLAQAIASDFKASSQEINSLIDQAPRLAQVVAAELGLRVPAEMKKMAEAGELSTEKFLSALQRGAATINEEYDNMGATVARSLTRLDNAFLSYIGKSDAISQSTSSLSLAIDGLAENFETVADAALVGAAALSGRYIAALVAAQIASYKMARDTVAVQLALAGMGGTSAKAATGLLLFDKAALAARGTLALLGGPAGIALTAATAIYAFSDSEETATTASKNYDDSLKNLNSIKQQMQGTTQTLSEKFVAEANAHIENTEAVLKETDATLDLLKAKLMLNESNALSVARTGQVPDQAGVEAGVLKLEERAAGLREEIKKNREELSAFFLKGVKPATAALEGNNGKGGLAGGMDKAAKAAADLQKELDKMQSDAVYEAVTMGMDEQSRAAYDLEVAVEELTNKYGNLTESQKKQVEQIKQMNASNNIAKAAIEAQKEALEENRRNSAEIERQMNQPFENAMRSIQETVADTFEGVFSGSINSAADAAQAIKSIFFRMAAEMATLQIFGAQGLNVMGAGVSGGLSGLSLGNLSKIGSSALNLFGGGDILARGLDAIGAQFGIGEILPWSGKAAAGTGLSASSSLTNGSFGGSLGGAAGGFVGNFGANALLGQRGIGADIGGTLGGIAGSFIPVPILGPMIGSFIGNAIGGLFGNKKPSSKMQTGLADLESGQVTARGGLRGEKFSQENQDMVDALTGSTAAMAKLFGITDKLSIAVSQRYGFEFAKTDDLKVFDADSPMRKQFKEAGDFLEALFTDFAENTTKKLSAAVAGALKNVDFKDVDQAISDIQFLQQFEDMVNPVSQLDAALAALEKQFKPIIDQATRLGLPLERINELYKEQKEAIEKADASAKLAQIENVLAGIMGKQFDALNEQGRAATEFVQKFSRIKESFTAFIAELTTGRFSPLHPVARLAAMRGEVESLGARAQLGDADAAEKLRELLPAFLELSGQVNGFNLDYAADRDRAEALSKATLSVFSRQVSIQEGIARAAADQIKVLQDGFSRMVAALQGGKDVFTGAATNAAGRNLNEITANGLTVGQTEAIYRSVTGYTGATGAGQLSAAVAAQGKQAEVIAAMKAAGAKGFATGGHVSGTGGVDNIPAMLSNGEFVINRAAAARIGQGTLHSMNSGGGGLEGKMDTLVRVVSSLVKVTAESGNVNANMLAGVQGQLADIQRSNRLMAAG